MGAAQQTRTHAATAARRTTPWAMLSAYHPPAAGWQLSPQRVTEKAPHPANAMLPAYVRPDRSTKPSIPTALQLPSPGCETHGPGENVASRDAGSKVPVSS